MNDFTDDCTNTITLTENEPVLTITYTFSPVMYFHIPPNAFVIGGQPEQLEDMLANGLDLPQVPTDDRAHLEALINRTRAWHRLTKHGIIHQLYTQGEYSLSRPTYAGVKGKTAFETIIADLHTILGPLQLQDTIILDPDKQRVFFDTETNLYEYQRTLAPLLQDIEGNAELT